MKCSAVLDHITFGVISWLEQRNDVTDVHLIDCQPAQQHMLEAWEEGNDCKLPEDLKQFYLTSNGLLIQWSVQFQGSVTPVGVMEVNPIESLNSVSLRSNEHDDVTLKDIEVPDDDTSNPNGYEQASFEPSFEDACFEVSSDGKHGKVCLVYDNDTTDDPTVWLLDRALQWHYLARTFLQYFRMLISHVGIKGWQYMYTEIGLSPETKQWFSYCLPQKLLGTTTNTNSNGSASLLHIERNEKNMEGAAHRIDFNTLFKQTKGSDKKKQATEQARQKSQQQAGKVSKASTTTSSRLIAKSSKINVK